ncbi:hypothetical protein Tco_0621804 [Tanacetum coccineum]
MMSLKLIAESASESAYNLLRFIQKQIDEYGSYDGTLATPEQTATGKEISYPFMAVSLDLSRLATTLNRLERSIQTGINKKEHGPMKNVINNAYSTARRPFNKITAANNNNFNKRVNTVNDKNVSDVRPNAIVNTARPKAVLSVVMGNKRNDVKASACCV